MGMIVVSLFLSKQLFYEELSEQKKLQDSYWNGMLYFFVIFQFSTLLFYPTITIRDPFAVMAMPSSSLEWMLAWLVVALYFFWVSWKRGLNREFLFLYFFVSYLVVETVYLAFHPFIDYRLSVDVPYYGGHPVSLYQMLVTVLILVVFMWQKQRKMDVPLILGRVLVMYGGSFGILSLLFEPRMMGMAVPAWFYFLLLFAGFATTTMMLKRKENQEVSK